MTQDSNVSAPASLFVVNHPQSLFLASLIARSVNGPSVLVLSRHSYLDLIDRAVLAELLGSFAEVIEVEFIDFKIARRDLGQAFAMRRRVKEITGLASRDFGRLVVFHEIYPVHAALLDAIKAPEVTVLGEYPVNAPGWRHTTLRGWLTHLYANLCTFFLARYVLDGRSNEAGLLSISAMKRPGVAYRVTSAYNEPLVRAAFDAIQAERVPPERGIALIVGSPTLCEYYPELGTPESQRRLVRAMIEQARTQGHEVLYIQHPREVLATIDEGIPRSQIIQPGLGEYFLERNKNRIAVVYGLTSALMTFSSLIGIPTVSFADHVGLSPENLARIKQFLANGRICYDAPTIGPITPREPGNSR